METIGLLHPGPPYNFGLLLTILSRYRYPPLDQTQDGAFWRVLRDEGQLALLRVHSTGTTQRPELQVQIAAKTGPINSHRLTEKIATILGVDANRDAFYTAAREDKTLWSIVEPLYGLPQHCAASVFESLCLTTIEQQIAWVAAQKGQSWMTQWAGNTLSHAGRAFYDFPTPQQIASATITELKPLKITFRRMGILIDIARQVVSGRLELESLRDRPPEQAYKALVAIKGIGHWTATWTITRVFGAQNYVGHNDVALQAAVNQYFYGGEGRIPETLVQETFARYGEYAGMAAHFTLMRLVYDRYA